MTLDILLGPGTVSSVFSHLSPDCSLGSSHSGVPDPQTHQGAPYLRAFALAKPTVGTPFPNSDLGLWETRPNPSVYSMYSLFSSNTAS